MVWSPAPAKVNLFLDILRRREDGFHDLHSVFLAVDLADRVELEFLGATPRGAGAPLPREITLSGPFSEGVPATEENLAARALSLFEDHLGRRLPPARLHVEKNIPSGAGLGGGSSDAAAVLLLANQLTGSILSYDALEALAARLGSDCAFFIRRGAAEATGRGENLRPFPSRELALLILMPSFSISTAAAYARLDPRAMGPRSDVEGLRRWMAGEASAPPRLLNHFEEALDGMYPELLLMRGFLRDHGAFIARLSGSGSATFGIFPDIETRDAAIAHVPANWRAFPARPAPSPPAG